MKYSFAGKEKLLSIGVYPEITLKEAVEQHDAARVQLRAGQDPSEEKQLQKLKAELSVDDRFEAIVLEWLETRGDLAASTWQRPSGWWRPTLSPAWAVARLMASVPLRRWQCFGAWRPRKRSSQLSAFATSADRSSGTQ